MSLKPPKKSDLGKSWMKPRRDKNILIYSLNPLRFITYGKETIKPSTHKDTLLHCHISDEILRISLYAILCTMFHRI